MKKRVTTAQVNAVLAAIRKAYPAYNSDYPGSQPIVLRDHDTDGDCIIAWEGGPFQWTYYFPFGGVEEEWGSTVKDVSESIPNELFVEPATHYSLALYRED